MMHNVSRVLLVWMILVVCCKRSRKAPKEKPQNDFQLLTPGDFLSDNGKSFSGKAKLDLMDFVIRGLDALCTHLGISCISLMGAS